MDKQEIRERWVAALRSGDYAQGHNWLKSDDGYCCLGVLCEVMGWEIREKAAVLTEGQFEEVGLRDQTGEFDATFIEEAMFERGGKSASLAALNDMEYDFDFIADFIESEGSRLFIG